MHQSKIYLTILSLLAASFGVHNFSIYTQEHGRPALSAAALKGQKIWQDSRCFSCHQLYGLGGYLGPDLTNVYSAKGKGPAYISAIVNSGVRSMPKFNFSPSENLAIIAYLREIDSTGYYPYYNARIGLDGWVEINEK